MSDNNKSASRVEKAASGIEEDVINLNERLQTRGDGEAIAHELRLARSPIICGSGTY